MRAWAALVRKELRQLLPLIVGLLALILWGEIDTLVLDAPDTDREIADGWISSSHTGRFEATFTLLLGLIVAYNLLPGEHQQRTIEFLYTLPLRRRTVFLTKYAVGCALLIVTGVIGTLLEQWEQSLRASSYAREVVPARFLPLLLFADVALVLISVAYGMLLSFFRRLGWVLFLLIWLGLEVAERVYPPLHSLNVKALLDVAHHGREPLVDWRAWQLHGGMAALSLALAARFWLSDHEGFAGFYERLRTSRPLRRVGLVLGSIAAALVAGGVIGISMQSSEPSGWGGRRRTATFETQHFHFTYHPGRTEQAMVVIREADRAYQRVRTWLPGTGGTIVADLTESSREHLGIAGWQKMRLDLRPQSPALLKHVLYHETSHVLAALASQVPHRQAGLRFFGEGLAEYIAYELHDMSEMRAHARLIAAGARTRFQLRPEDLVDAAGLLERYDEFLLYAFGEVWVAAIVEACGAATPGRLVRTLGDPALPDALVGMELWRAALQQNGCDLHRVTSRYEQHLRRLEKEATRLPVASARPIGEENGQLVFDLQVEAPTPGPWSVTVRLRDGATTPADDIVAHTLPLATGKTQRVRLPPPARGGRSYQLQVGAAPDEDARPFFSRWRSVTR